MATILTRQQIYDIFITELQAQAPQLTDTNEGALCDVLAGVTSQVLTEMSNLTVTEFAKTFFNSADGPEVTGGPDDLQTLAVDHFGDSFARPLAATAAGTVTFSRATTAKGNVLIAAGTAVATSANAAGRKTRFLTTADVTMTGLTINAQIKCDTAGSAGNVSAGTINTVQTTLTDNTITVTNAANVSGGSDKYTDAQYRAFILSKLQSLKGATLAAIKATVLTVAGIATATPFEKLVTVIEYDIGTGLPKVGASYFNIVTGSVYIADSNGAASSTLVASAQAAIDSVRAAGTNITAIGAAAVVQAWTASVTLNAGGPNFATFQTDKTKIINTMSQYISNLAIGTGFNRAAAQTAIMAIWGPTGTNDLTAFTTSAPIGDIAITATQKLTPGTMSIV